MMFSSLSVFTLLWCIACFLRSVRSFNHRSIVKYCCSSSLGARANYRARLRKCQSNRGGRRAAGRPSENTHHKHSPRVIEGAFVGLCFRRVSFKTFHLFLNGHSDFDGDRSRFSLLCSDHGFSLIRRRRRHVCDQTQDWWSRRLFWLLLSCCDKPSTLTEWTH